VRTLTIVLVALLALLPECLACSLCRMGGGPCAPAVDACCEEEGERGAPDGAAPAGAEAPAEDPCTCGEGCLERDPAPGGDAAVSPACPPASAPAPFLHPPDPSAAAPRLPARTPLPGGPPPRLALRI
jgi:hypothetical protein